MKLLLLSICVMIAGCSVDEENARIRKEIDHFHTQLNLGQFDEIYSETTQKYKNASSVQDSKKLLRAIQKNLGNERATKVLREEPHVNPWARAFFLECETDFEKGKAIETFVFISEPHSIRLETYFISSKSFVDKLEK